MGHSTSVMGYNTSVMGHSSIWMTKEPSNDRGSDALTPRLRAIPGSHPCAPATPRAAPQVQRVLEVLAVKIAASSAVLDPPHLGMALLGLQKMSCASAPVRAVLRALQPKIAPQGAAFQAHRAPPFPDPTPDPNPSSNPDSSLYPEPNATLNYRYPKL